MYLKLRCKLYNGNIIQQGNTDTLKQKFIRSFKAAASNSLGKIHLIRASQAQIIIRCAVWYKDDFMFLPAWQWWWGGRRRMLWCFNSQGY